jgi:hypothetical protein
MFHDPSRLRESRLFARPAISGTGSFLLALEQGVDHAKRVKVAQRLIAAYQLAMQDVRVAPIQAADSDLWTAIVAKHMPELVAILDSADAPGLARFLINFGADFTWFGGLTLGLDGYFRARDAGELAFLYADKLACLAEAVGAVSRECPEQGDYGVLPGRPVDELVALIEREIGISIEPPREVVYTVGLRSSRGPLHYRHFNAIYSALVAASMGKRICEFGAGLGMTAVYARRLGALDYTIYDLPLVNVIAGNYLLCALGESAVSLYREPEHAGTVRVLPFWTCCEQPAGRFDVALNQDSFPEIEESLVRRYVDEIARTTTGYLVSINQEAQAPISDARRHLWVARMLSGDRRFTRIRRSPYWMREGYVEEIYRLDAPAP